MQKVPEVTDILKKDREPKCDLKSWFKLYNRRNSSCRNQNGWQSTWEYPLFQPEQNCKFQTELVVETHLVPSKKRISKVPTYT